MKNEHIPMLTSTKHSGGMQKVTVLLIYKDLTILAYM